MIRTRFSFYTTNGVPCQALAFLAFLLKPVEGRWIQPFMLRQAQHEREDLPCPYDYGPINNSRWGEAAVLSPG